MTKVDVRLRVSELQAAAARSSAESVVLNRERVLHRLSELSREAQAKGQYSAAAKCEELIGREIGMFIHRSEHVVWDGDINKLTDSQLDMMIRVVEEAAAGQRQLRPNEMTLLEMIMSPSPTEQTKGSDAEC